MSQTAMRTCWMQCDRSARTTTVTCEHGDFIETLRHASVGMHRSQLEIAKRSGFPLARKFGEPASARPHEGLRTRTSLAMAMYPTSNILAHDNSKIVVSYLSFSLTVANASSTFSLPGHAVAWERCPYSSHIAQRVHWHRRSYTSPSQMQVINTPIWQTSINQRITNSLRI